jgi:hypothetical protein
MLRGGPIGRPKPFGVLIKSRAGSTLRHPARADKISEGFFQT